MLTYKKVEKKTAIKKRAAFKRLVLQISPVRLD